MQRDAIQMWMCDNRLEGFVIVIKSQMNDGYTESFSPKNYGSQIESLWFNYGFQPIANSA